MAESAAPFTLRSEQADDQAFLRRLFDADRAPELRAAGLADAQLDTLLGIQFLAQSRVYRAQFPQARFQIVERDGAPAGRLVQDDRAGAVHIVDIALLPEHRRQGLGAALIGAVQRACAAQGRGLTAKVLFNNIASRAMFQKLGFVEDCGDNSPHLDLAWTPAI